MATGKVKVTVDPSVTYVAKQDAWIKENNIEIGTTVLVASICETNKGGWCNSWTADMENAVGCELKVIRFDGEFGITLEKLDPDHFCGYSFPFFVLNVVK